MTKKNVFTARTSAIKTLMNRQQHDDAIHTMILAWLQDKEEFVRYEVLSALKSWPQPSSKIVNMVVAQLKEDWLIRWGALGVLENWSQLSNDAFDAIAKRLSDSDDSVREAAARALRNRPQPTDSVIKAIVAALDIHVYDRYGYFKVALLEVLESWRPLDDYLLYAAAKLLGSAGNRDYFRARAISKMFRTSPQPSDNTVNAIMEHVTNPNWEIRQAVLQAVGSWPELNEEFLVAIATCLVDKVRDVKKAAFYALTNQSFLPFEVLEPYMESMYKVALRISFTEHVYWLTKAGQAFIVVGARKVEWKRTKDNSVTGPKSESSLSSDYALWLHDCAPAWRRRCGFGTQALSE